MAFIASKYEGGIMINDVDRLAPLFSGGEKLKYTPIEGKDISAFQTKAAEWKEIEGSLLYEKMLYTAYVNAGNLKYVEALADVETRLGAHYAMQKQLETEVVNYNKAITDERGKKISGSNIMYDSATEYIAADNGVIKNPQEFMAITAKTNNDIENIVANMTPLYDQNGKVNTYSPSIVYTGKTKKVKLDEFINGIEAKFQITSADDNAVSANNANASKYTSWKNSYTSNFVPMYNAYSEQKDQFINDQALFQEARGEVKQILYSGGLRKGKDGKFVISGGVKGRRKVNSSGLNEGVNVSFLTKDNNGNYFYETYMQGKPDPIYSTTQKVEDADGNITYERGKVLDYTPKNLSYERAIGISKEESHFLGLYLDLEGYGASVLEDEDKRNAYIGNLYSAAVAIEPDIAAQLGVTDKLPTYKEGMSEEEKEIYDEFETNLINMTKVYGNQLLDALTTSYIYGELEEKITSKVNSSVGSEQKTQEFDENTLTENATANAIANIFEDMQKRTYDINGGTSNGSAVIAQNVTVDVKTVSPETMKMFVSAELYDTVSMNNTYDPNNKDQEFATIGGILYNLNPAQQINLGTNYSNSNLSISLNITGQNNPSILPFDATKAPGAYVVGYDNNIYLTAGTKGNKFNIELPKGANINDSFNAAKDIYTGMKVAVSFEDLASQEIVVYKDEYNKTVDVEDLYIAHNKWKVGTQQGKSQITYAAYATSTDADIVYDNLIKYFKIEGHGDNRYLMLNGRLPYENDNTINGVRALYMNEQSKANLQAYLNNSGTETEALRKLAGTIAREANASIDKYLNSLPSNTDAEGKEYIVITIGGLFPGKEGNDKARALKRLLANNKDARFGKKDKEKLLDIDLKDDFVDMETSWVVIDMMQQYDIGSSSLLNTTKTKNAFLDGLGKYQGKQKEKTIVPKTN